MSYENSSAKASRLLQFGATAIVVLSLGACATAPVPVPKADFPEITPVSSAVPKECAALLGGWAGTWPYGNFGQLRLWVTAIDPSCTATYTYNGRSGTETITKGTLKVPCGGGTCYFSPSGDGLAASYSESATQRTTFGRIIPAS